MSITSPLTRCLLSLALLATVVVLPACEKQDLDGDGWAADDCDDENAAINPDAAEVCDEADNDCDGTTDINVVEGPTFYPDNDDDGFGDENNPTLACHAPDGYVEDGTDCDDSDELVNPEAEERCDPVDVVFPVDEDCDRTSDDADDDKPLPDGYPDRDGDGWGDGAGEFTSCDDPTAEQLGDCDDTSSGVSPDADELCNGYDDDCDGLVDDDDEDDAADALTWFRDSDGDGHGDPDSIIVACPTPTGYVASDDDCDDGNAAINPTQLEICDPYDVSEDCDAFSDDEDPDVDPGSYSIFFHDEDSDGWGGVEVLACDPTEAIIARSGDCDDANALANPDVLEEECNGDDDNCDGDVPAEEFDGDGDGVLACSTPADCDDTDPTVGPFAAETCNGRDDDCDDLVDDDDHGAVEGALSWWPDRDDDGYGDPDHATDACAAPVGYILAGGDPDCNDGLAEMSPALLDVCDDLDNDCDGVVNRGPGRACLDAASAILDYEPPTTEKFGFSVAAGDLDGDGVFEALVGDPSCDYSGSERGCGAVYTSPVRPGDLPDRWIVGTSLDQDLGRLAFVAGDFDFDGVEEAGFGLSQGGLNAETGENLGGLHTFGWDGSPGVFMSAETTYDVYPNDGPVHSIVGGHPTCVPGAPDLVVGMADAGGSYRGRVYVLCGSVYRATGTTLSRDSIPEDSYVLQGAVGSPYRMIGETVLQADFDGDGLYELVFSGNGYDAADSPATPGVVWGYRKSDMVHDAITEVGGDVDTSWFQIIGSNDDDQLGSALAVGDLDRDGRADDLVVGARYADYPSADQGAVYVVAIHPTAGTSGEARSLAFASVEGDKVGESVAIADMNGDGNDDLVLTAQGYEQGAVAVFLSMAATCAGGCTVDDADYLWLRDGVDLARPKMEIAALGDQDGDGRDEILVGLGDDNSAFVVALP